MCFVMLLWSDCVNLQLCLVGSDSQTLYAYPHLFRSLGCPGPLFKHSIEIEVLPQGILRMHMKPSQKVIL